MKIRSSRRSARFRKKRPTRPPLKPAKRNRKSSAVRRKMKQAPKALHRPKATRSSLIVPRASCPWLIDEDHGQDARGTKTYEARCWIRKPRQRVRRDATQHRLRRDRRVRDEARLDWTAVRF